MYRHHTVCRACGFGGSSPSTLKQSTAAAGVYDKEQESLIPVMDLGLQPPANDFVTLDGYHAGFAPLKVLVCPKCLLAQLSVVVAPEILYRNYAYVTSQSETMKKHFDQLIVDIQKECGVGSVLEVGSNDGTLLKEFQTSGFGPVYGIDPAENLATIANKIGVNTLCDFFDKDSALQACRQLGGEPSVIVARHVFCHCDDWRGFIAAVDDICAEDTAVFIEIPWVLDQLRSGSFDQIYFEHLSYLNLGALHRLLDRTHLHIHWVKHYSVHGGTLVICLRTNDDQMSSDNSLYEFLDREQELSLDAWRKFAQQSEVAIMELGSTVRNLVSQGKTVVGYGASAKSTVWLNACGFTKKEIRFICDETKSKQYKVSPGTDIPVVDPGALTRELPDYAVLFAWNFGDEIMRKEKIFANKGHGKWIVPVPKIQIVCPDGV